MDIKTLSESFQAETITKPIFYRGLMNHPTWSLAGERTASGQLQLGVLRPQGGGKILEIFSGPDATQAFEQAHGEPVAQPQMHLVGHELFGMLSDGLVDRLNIDPGSPHTFHFLRNQLGLLRRWAQTVALECSLQDPNAVPNPLGLLASFEHYHLVVLPGQGEQYSLVLAPDSRGRSLGAIFTSEDAAVEFGQAIAKELGRSPEVREVAARPLFERLKAMTLQGLVFNPLTDLPPRALSAAIIDPILQRAPR